jgi:hypothetical protein
MKKIVYISILVSSIALAGCTNDFLEEKNLYEKQDQNFYRNPNDVGGALTAIYSCLTTDNGKDDPIFVANLLSDDSFGGGGPDNVDFQNTDAFENTLEDRYDGLWAMTYQGIFRANMLISRFNQATYKNEDARRQDLGEAHYLRAYLYLNLARFFGTVPLITIPQPSNNPKASADDIFAQIAADLKVAIDSMPSTKINEPSSPQLGHATKWAAEALMARAFLFYTGYYNKTEIALPDGGKITKNDVINWIDDCIANSGHDLISDFRNLWPCTFAVSDYPYVENNGLKWIGEDGANIETVFAIKFTIYGGAGHYSNQLAVYSSLRAQEKLVPFGMGYGGGPCNPQLWNSYSDNDLRKRGTILDITDPNEGMVSTNYLWGQWQAQQETGLWQKKYTTIQVNTDEGLKLMYQVLTDIKGNYQRCNLQDEVVIRFSDILLMGAELGSTNAQQYYDRVRTRAGLPTRQATLENIKEERRFEFAFEGIRYFDLLRWHDMEAATSVQVNIPVKNNNVDALYTAKYRPETGGFLPIPESQIRLSEGVLIQNAGW